MGLFPLSGKSLSVRVVQAQDPIELEGTIPGREVFRSFCAFVDNGPMVAVSAMRSTRSGRGGWEAVANCLVDKGLDPRVRCRHLWLAGVNVPPLSKPSALSNRISQ